MPRGLISLYLEHRLGRVFISLYFHIISCINGIRFKGELTSERIASGKAVVKKYSVQTSKLYNKLHFETLTLSVNLYLHVATFKHF